MEQAVLNAEELKAWIANDPYREAIIRAEAPVKGSTLMQIISGRYSPSPRLAKAILAVMRDHPLRAQASG